MPRLRVFVGGRETTACQLTRSVVIGRGEECDLRLVDSQVSRRHCRVEPAEQGWVVIDLRSSNGTVLEGRRVERSALRDGDRLIVGAATIQFEAAQLSRKPPNLWDQANKAPAAQPVDKTKPKTQAPGLSIQLRKKIEAFIRPAQEERIRSGGKNDAPWYRQRVSTGAAFAATIIAAVLIYLFVWGVPSTLTLSRPKPQKAIPQASPFNRD